MNEITRRDIIKKLAYVAPAILTLKAMPAFAQGGSGYSGDGKPGESARGGNSGGCGSNFFERILCWLEKVF